MKITSIGPIIEIKETGKIVNYSKEQVFFLGFSLMGFANHIEQEEIGRIAKIMDEMIHNNQGFIARSIITAVLLINPNDIKSFASGELYLPNKESENSLETGFNIIKLMKPELGLSLSTLANKREDELTRSQQLLSIFVSIAHQAFSKFETINSSIKDIELQEIKLDLNIGNGDIAKLSVILVEPLHIVEGK
jgi:hypothetical protein